MGLMIGLINITIYRFAKVIELDKRKV